MTLSEGEKVRARHVLTRLRGCIDAVEIALNIEGDAPLGYDAGNAVMHTALELGIILAKLDAYQRAERSRLKPL